MHPFNSVFFEHVLQDFLATTRQLFLKFSLFIQLKGIVIVEGTVTIPITVNDVDDLDKSQTLVKHTDNATFSATAMQCYRATTKQFAISFSDNDKISHPVVSRISEILEVSEENVALFTIDETTHMLQVIVDEQTITSEFNLTMAIVEILQLFANLNNPIKSIEEIKYPVICFGSMKLLIEQKDDTFTIEIYSQFDILCGEWINIRFQDESSKNSEDKAEKAIEYDSPTMKCMLKIGIDCSEENRHETFTAMGLDSLKTAELEMALQADYPSYRIPTGIIERCPTVAELDAYLLSRADMFEEINNKDTTAYSYRVPLSPQQKRLIFMSKLEPTANAQFNEVLAFSMSSDRFDERRLSAALNTVVMRHTVLRTSYRTDSQRVHSGTESFLAIIECDMPLEEFVSCPIDICKCSLQFSISKSADRTINCLVVHHIAVDGQSISIITHEIEAFYMMTTQTQSRNPRQYADYCALTSGLRYDVQLAEWTKKLNGREFQLLPIDKPRAGKKSCKGAVLQKRIANSLQISLRKIRTIANCSNFCVFVAIYKFLIYKTTGIADFPIGFPSTLRGKEFWTTVGCFVNTTPIFEVVDPSMTVAEYIKRVSSAISESRNIDVPLDVLVSHLNIDRDELLPLFQVLLVMDNIKVPATNQDIVLLDLPNRFVKYEQAWYFQDDGISINVRIEYDSDLFRVETISDLLDRFLHILDDFGKYSFDRSLKDITITTKSELKSIVDTSIANGSDIPEITVYQIFQKNLCADSSINFKEQRMSYRELDEKSSYMAADIFRVYCGHYGELPSRDRCAVIFMKRCPELLLTILGIWKSGLTAVPVSLDWPPERIVRTMEMLENPILIENDSEELKRTVALKNFAVTTPKNIPLSVQKWRNMTDLSDLGYITCTSGTTGTPKAVCTEFRGHSNLATCYTRKFLIRKDSHTYQVVNYGFDIFFADLTKTLVNGAAMTLADGLIPKLEEMNGVTNAYIMPVYLSSLSITDIKSMNFLESIQFGGETIQALTLAHLLQTEINVYQEYGVTEQTVYTACNRMKICSPISEVGTPYSNLYTVVRDSDGQLLPTKYHGVHYHGGCGLTRGYYNDPKLTAAVTHNGLLGKEFRSGDLVKSEAGRLQFVGREDLQVKIRGRRIELLEIQYQIAQHDDVEANIVGVDDSDGIKELVAYVIFKNSKKSKEATDDIRSFLSSRLPSYCVPKHFISQKTFPLNQNGKVDVTQLPKPRRDSQPTNPRPARNGLETAVISSFRKYTRRDHMANECFFANGGDSVKAMLVVQDLAAQNLHVDLKSFFSLRTAEKIALFLEETSMPPKECRSNSEILSYAVPLSAQQKRIWFLLKMHPHRDSYVICLQLDFFGTLNQRRLRESFNLVIMNNPALKSIIDLVDHEPSLLRLSGTECFHTLTQYELADIQVNDSALIIGQLLEEGDSHHRLDLRIHHVISDGRSLAIIGEQLANAYNGREVVRDSDLHQDEDSDDSLGFWREYLEDYEPITIQERSENNGVKGKAGYLHEVLDFIDDLKLHEFCLKYGCTLYHIVMLSFVNALRMMYDLKDVVVGTTIANRSPSNMNRVGLYANTLPVRVKEEFPDLERQLRYTVDQILAAMEHQTTSLASIVGEVVDHRDAIFTPLFQHVVTLESTSLSEFPAMNGLQTNVTEVRSEYVQFDQSWIFHPGKKLTLSIQYDTGRYSLVSVKELVAHFKRTLWNILKHHALRSTRQPPRKILCYDTPRNKCLGRIFRAQAEKLPHNICLETNSGRTTYSETLDMAENLAHRMQNAILLNDGEIPLHDDVICLILIESVGNHIAIEAVHLLGCAYLSLSPDTPFERIRYILADCQAKLIVTTLHFQNLPSPILSLELTRRRNCPRVLSRSCSDSLSYLIYTSGTTGVPKGVCVGHQSTVNMLEHATRLYNFRPMARVLQFTKSSFDASISNTFGCLLNGGVLSIRDDTEEVVRDLSARQPITVLHMTPIILDMFDDDELDQLSDVERWSFGGETISESTMNSMIKRGNRLVQLYGPTEATCYVTSLEMKNTTKATCLGPTISGVYYGLCSFQKYVVQRQSLGEFYCWGENLARGYIGRIEGGFVENPYRTVEDEILGRNTRIYLVGDKIRCDGNQYLYFLGREDDQVKIKGQRIQLTEIENVVRNMDGVQNVVAVLQKDKSNMNHIVLFYTGTRNDLSTYLRDRLQNYMLPTKILHLTEFPLTANGKINKTALSNRNDISDSSSAVRKPNDYFKETVLYTYRQVLKQSKLTVCTNFFQAGGHSLLVIRLVDALHDKLSVSVPIVKVFEFPVVADLAEWIKGCRQEPLISIEEELTPKKGEDDLPTPLQLTLLRCFRNPQLRRLYDIALDITLKKAISTRKLVDVFNSLTMIHPSLRTRFVRIHKKYLKEVLSGTECYQNFAIKASSGLDPLQKPPFVICTDGTNLQLVVNHIITDGHSMQLIVKNLLRLLNGERIPMDDGHLFHCWLLNQFQKHGNDDRRYWKRRLESFVYNHLPTSQPRMIVSGNEAACLNFPMSQLHSRLGSWMHTYSCTPFVAVLALFSRTLQSISNDPALPIAIGFPVNLRTQKLANSVGYGISTVMVAHDANDNPEKVVPGISMEVGQAMSHAFLPYEELLELSPSKKLFSVMLIFDEYSLKENDVFQVNEAPVTTTKFELSIFVDYNNDRIRVEYNKELYDESFVRSTIKIFDNVTYDWFAIPSRIPDSEELLPLDVVVHNTSTIRQLTEFSALPEVRTIVTNSDSVELSYSCDISKDETIIEVVEQLPEPLRPDPLEFPLSNQQLQMYYLSLEDSSFHVLPFIKKFSKNIPISEIHKALLYEIQRHESLRTIFFEIQGEPRQLVLSMTEAYVGLNFEKTTDLKGRVDRFTKSSVELSEGVPLRAVLLEIPDYFVAVLRLHHIISDGWSTGMLERELEEILAKLNASEDPILKRQTVSYRKFCLETLPVPDIDNGYIEALTESNNIPETASYNGSVEVMSFTFSESVARQWMKSCGVSVFVIMLRILSECIINEYRLTSINIGTTSSGRSSWSKNVFGYFLNNLVFHIRQNDQLSSSERLQQHVTKVTSMNVPYATLTDVVRQRKRHLRPLFQVYFNCRYDMEAHKDDDAAIKSLLPIKSEFPLEIDLDKDSTTYSVTLRIQDCLPEGSGKRLMEAIQLQLLAGVSQLPTSVEISSTTNYPLEVVLEISKKILRLETIDCNENFFSSGGNSLQVISFIELIEETIGVEIDISEVYQMKSFLKFANYLRSVIPRHAPKSPNQTLQTSSSSNKCAGVNECHPTGAGCLPHAPEAVVINVHRPTGAGTIIEHHFSESEVVNQHRLSEAVAANERHPNAAGVTNQRHPAETGVVNEGHSSEAEVVSKDHRIHVGVVHKHHPRSSCEQEKFTIKTCGVIDIPSSGLNVIFFDILKTYSRKSAITEPGDTDITYEELADLIFRQAASIKDRYCQINGETLRSDTIIPVLGKRSASTIITCLSVMAAGAAYLPMDLAWPMDRLRTLLAESHARCYIGPEIAGVELCTIRNHPAFRKPYPLFNCDSEEDLAYVIYTSGTTSTPKAVCICRQSVINMIASSTVDFRIRSEDVTYQFTMFIYDNSVLEIFMTLANGARLIVAQAFIPRVFTDLLTYYGITHCLLFPGVVATFNEAHFKKLSALRYWIVGAEKLPQKLLSHAIDEGINVIQNFGPTETTAYALTRHMRSTDRAENLGRAIQNTQILVEENGQLLIKGIGVMRGYLNQQPHNSFSRSRWYWTGDHVRFLPNGDVLFVGRTDSQVKIRGHRVELTEIEEMITSLDGVNQCKVLWRSNDEKLLAFCTGQLADSSGEHIIQERCRKSLPSHMCPTHVIFLENFPLTKNSKVDLTLLSERWKDFYTKNSFLDLVGNVLGQRVCPSSTFLELGGSTTDALALKALYFLKFGRPLDVIRLMKVPLQNVEEAGSDIAYGKDHTDEAELLNQRLQGVWSKVLKHKNFDNNDHFYFCGGNSISLTKLRFELNKEFRTNFDVKDLLTSLVFSDMITMIRSEKVLPRIVTVVHRSVARPHYSLIFIHALYGGCAAYVNLIRYFRHLGNVDVLTVEHPNTFDFETDDPRLYESIQSLAASYYTEVRKWLNNGDGNDDGSDDANDGGDSPARVVLIGASIGGTIAVEMSRHSRHQCDVIVIDSGTDYEKLHEYKFDQHFKSTTEALVKYELDDETRFWMLVNSWDLLQLLKDYKLAPSTNLKSLTVFSVDGTDLGWSRVHPTSTRKIAGTHVDMLSAKNSEALATEIIHVLSL